MDEDRIRNIARAMCRAAKLDPDAGIDGAKPQQAPASLTDLNWTLFREQAERFCARHLPEANSVQSRRRG